MVLESFQRILEMKHKTGDLFLVGIVLTTIAIFLSLWVFPQYASIIMVVFIVIPSIPFMLTTIKGEEIKDECIEEEKTLLKEHSKVLMNYMVLFIGITVAFAFWYVVLPQETTSVVFNVQATTISQLGVKVTGNMSAETLMFKNILFNNLKVLIFCILFSFCYGAGALFVLTWNASVLGAAIGNFIRTELSQYATTLGFGKAAGYLHVFSVGLFRYSIHGIPEIMAYFAAGLAGGIISFAVIRQNFRTHKFYHTLFDSFDLIMLSIGLTVVAAVLEVFVTPLVFG
jgi:uncharacterized membrane protein SpoIIM required for sporulation